MWWFCKKGVWVLIFGIRLLRLVRVVQGIHKGSGLPLEVWVVGLASRVPGLLYVISALGRATPSSYFVWVAGPQKVATGLSST